MDSCQHRTSFDGWFPVGVPLKQIQDAGYTRSQKPKSWVKRYVRNGGLTLSMALKLVSLGSQKARGTRRDTFGVLGSEDSSYVVLLVTSICCPVFIFPVERSIPFKNNSTMARTKHIPGPSRFQLKIGYCPLFVGSSFRFRYINNRKVYEDQERRKCYAVFWVARTTEISGRGFLQRRSPRGERARSGCGRSCSPSPFCLRIRMAI